MKKCQFAKIYSAFPRKNVKFAKINFAKHTFSEVKFAKINFAIFSSANNFFQ